MPATEHGIRHQRLHKTLSPAILDWFNHHYEPSNFDGRFQIGFRRADEEGIWPLVTGDIGVIGEFLKSMHISGHLDYYITANSFSGIERKADSLFSLHNIVIDIDAHSTGDAGDTFNTLGDPDNDSLGSLIWRLTGELFDNPSFPSPSAIIRTGRGLQLWWHIVPMSIKCVPWFKEIHYTLILALKQFIDDYQSDFPALQVDGAASQNLVGYFRLPGTINTHASAPATIEQFTPITHNTHDLIKWAKQWKQDNPPTKAQVPEPQENFSGRYSQSEIYILKNLYTSAFFRVNQIIQLRIFRDNDIGEETRNNMCLIVYNALLPALGHDKAWDKLLSFNEGFKQPMTERELHQTIDTSRKKNGYRYKNETLIRFLGITNEEQKAIGLYVPAGPYSPFTRITPNASRKASHKTVTADRNAKIRALKEKGVSNTKIAKELGVGRNTVSAAVGVTPMYFAAVKLFESAATNQYIAEKLGITKRTVIRYRNKWNGEAGG